LFRPLNWPGLYVKSNASSKALAGKLLMMRPAWVPGGHRYRTHTVLWDLRAYHKARNVIVLTCIVVLLKTARNGLAYESNHRQGCALPETRKPQNAPGQGSRAARSRAAGLRILKNDFDSFNVLLTVCPYHILIDQDY